MRTRDGWISLLPYTDKHWKAFFHEVGRDDLGGRYNIASRSERNANIRNLYGHLRELAPLRTTAEWMKLCDALDIPATPIYALDELPEHPHLKAVKLFQESVHPEVGPIREIRPTARFARTPTSIRRPAPSLGRDTGEVLREAGFDDNEIKALSRR